MTAEFLTAITPVFSVTFRNHSNMLIGAQETFIYIINVDKLHFLIFCGNRDNFFRSLLTWSSIEQYLFEI